ncbi:MAG: S-methyl-5-thioribose kinase [Alteromonadaceae bacterium]|nr:S-methyl-5-thioribose kinase [Alteromonadaceae bacterium]
MAYVILNKTTIINYLNTINSVTSYFGEHELEVDEIGDGNLNYVYIIKSKTDPQKALILKQAVPYLRCVGEEYPLSKERMTYEIRALQLFTSTTSAYIPKLYDVNETMSTVIMQFLGEHLIMRKGMIAQITYPDFADHISTFLAQNLFKTSSLHLNSTEKRQLIDRFNQNTELCKLTEDFVFTFAFMEHETNDVSSGPEVGSEISSEISPEVMSLFSDLAFKQGVLGLKYKFMTQTDALLHGDLHTGSIMLNQDETFVIDPEFAFVGPYGFDIGALIGNLIMSYASHVAVNSAQAYLAWILQTIEDVLVLTQDKFLNLWQEQKESALITEGFINETSLTLYKNEFMLNMLKDTVGFAGCKMARRMFGIAGVADIREIEDDVQKEKAINITLKIAKLFVKNYQNITSVKDVMQLIEENGH